GIPLVYEMRASWEDAAVHHGTTRPGSLRYRLSRRLETRVLRKADAVTTICEGLRQDILGRGIEAAKVTVIPNAVDAEWFAAGGRRSAALGAELGLAGKTVLGFIGSFYRYEGLALLLRALATVRATHPGVCLLLVGGGPEEDRLRAMAGDLGVGDAVIFAGRVPHGDVRDYYDLADIFVYPRVASRLTDTVTPLKPLEAMAQRGLVVASDVAGHRELIRHGDTGILFPADDDRALAAALLGLLDAPDEWPLLRDAGRRYVEQERTWSRSVSRYDSVYSRVLS
ncbi:MAG: glycosyltransferase, partial [Gammaproteobacteria bacterium]